MPYVCVNCWEVYRDAQDYCPKRSCYGNPVIEVDELVIVKEIQGNKLIVEKQNS